jgi:uncharacterized surface protein with fasciclin (FAS1) repeats
MKRAVEQARPRVFDEEPMISNRLFVAAGMAALFAAGAASAQTPAPAPAQAAPMAAPAAPPVQAMGAPGTPFVRIAPAGDMIATLQASGQFKTLLKALDDTGLTAVIKAQQNLTLFAPTDAGFEGLPQGRLNELLQQSNIAQLQSILSYHLVNTRVDAAKLNGARGPVPTVANAPIYVDGTTQPVKVNNAIIVQADIAAGRGTGPARRRDAGDDAAAGHAARRALSKSPPGQLEAEVGGPYGPPTFLLHCEKA